MDGLRGQTAAVSTLSAWLFVAATWLALGALTAAGAVRRGQGRCLALVSGMFFPVAWVMWYLIDKRRARTRTVGRSSARQPIGRI